MTEFKLFLDSSVWLGYFLANISEAKGIVDNERKILFTSIISIHEIVKKLRKLGKPEKEVKNSIQFLENNSLIVNLNKDIVLNSVENCEKYKLHTIDSLIYSSALETKTLFVTADKDFKKTPKTRIIEIK